ncbi:ABC transporter permease subunit [Halorussus amylolyticus]|uniref:ABC transporter permease subunit n=1 Tax=Halorussus amylolyticus TaxID=1126242 RepID=UPI001047746A|nr:ABC transporter permease subunit [Halorussus amylolyticus]
MSRPAFDRLLAVVGRELTTVVRTRAFLALTAGFAAVVGMLAWTANAGGYVPLVLDLLAPVEVLVPALALAFGYRALLGDDERGELDVVRTYPVSRATFVFGTYLGRASALLVAVLVPLLAVAAVVPLSGGTESSFLATHAGMDSPIRYVRFVVLTAGFALVVAAVAIAISATAGTARAGLALATAFGVALVLGFDAGLVAGLAGGVVPDAALPSLLALSPNSAFRGLVLETVVGGVETGTPAASPVAGLAGLGAWLVASLAVAVFAVWPKTDR